MFSNKKEKEKKLGIGDNCARRLIILDPLTTYNFLWIFFYPIIACLSSDHMVIDTVSKQLLVLRVNNVKT